MPAFANPDGYRDGRASSQMWGMRADISPKFSRPMRTASAVPTAIGISVGGSATRLP